VITQLAFYLNTTSYSISYLSGRFCSFLMVKGCLPYLEYSFISFFNISISSSLNVSLLNYSYVAWHNSLTQKMEMESIKYWYGESPLWAIFTRALI